MPMPNGAVCQPKIQVLELFSGIGGVHYALEGMENDMFSESQ